MKLFENKPDYVRLDDDVSFQIVRTNPKLTTNTKLMYDGKNLYMESYDADPILSTIIYKHHKVFKSGLFNKDISQFLKGTNMSAYSVGQNVSNTTILDSFDNQFENMYWCGVESINSDIYPQEMGCVAPLYIRKKMPNYFVIFRVDCPATTNLVIGDYGFNFKEDIIKRATIIKSFDLREGTPIGDYIRKYIGQRDFKYDQSIYVNFSSHKIYYYGIDKVQGILTQKVENFEDQLLNNDNTILKTDDWITSGFERNNLIFPYIINFEFLFDDKEIGEYKFARYFGMYCNDIDLFDLKVEDCVYSNGVSTIITDFNNTEDIVTNDFNGFYYIKDRNRNIYSVDFSDSLPNYLYTNRKISEDDLNGFEKSSVSVYMEKLKGAGKAFMIFEITKPLRDRDEISFYKIENGSGLGTFRASSNKPVGEVSDFVFSCRGTTTNIANALAKAIRTYDDDAFEYITAYNINNFVVIESLYPGSNMNNFFDITIPETLKDYIKKNTDGFGGGTDFDGCIFKVYTSDEDVLFDKSETDRDVYRYIKCGFGRNDAKILAFLPYIHDNKIDEEYSIIITDDNGKYVNISSSERIELIDKYYPKLGILSYFPVRDFDFDTVSSQYGDYSLMQNELDYINTEITVNDSGSDVEDEKNLTIVNNIPYGKFYDVYGNKITTEYEYFLENILPELSVISKCTPFISKWGYIDEAKDSCENPYRLNTSKIFDTCNFSANTFVGNGDIMEYTHSMPYYVSNRSINEINVNEYQYIPIEMSAWASQSVEGITSYFSKTTGDDPFSTVFGDLSNTQYRSKRFNKKYSRFLLGNRVSDSSTLFRGVKFSIKEIQNGKETKTGKYNDYRFSFVYIPSFKKVSDKVYFVKNDTFKFIVGFMFFDMKTSDTTHEFNKAYVYAGAMGYYTLSEYIPCTIERVSMSSEFIDSENNYRGYINENNSTDKSISEEYALRTESTNYKIYFDYNYTCHVKNSSDININIEYWYDNETPHKFISVVSKTLENVHPNSSGVDGNYGYHTDDGKKYLSSYIELQSNKNLHIKLNTSFGSSINSINFYYKLEAYKDNK